MAAPVGRSTSEPTRFSCPTLPDLSERSAVWVMGASSDVWVSDEREQLCHRPLKLHISRQPTPRIDAVILASVFGLEQNVLFEINLDENLTLRRTPNFVIEPTKNVMEPRESALSPNLSPVPAKIQNFKRVKNSSWSNLWGFVRVGLNQKSEYTF